MATFRRRLRARRARRLTRGARVATLTLVPADAHRVFGRDEDDEYQDGE
jgi:hypothetical protein